MRLIYRLFVKEMYLFSCIVGIDYLCLYVYTLVIHRYFVKQIFFFSDIVGRDVKLHVEFNF